MKEFLVLWRQGLPAPKELFCLEKLPVYTFNSLLKPIQNFPKGKALIVRAVLDIESPRQLLPLRTLCGTYQTVLAWKESTGSHLLGRRSLDRACSVWPEMWSVATCSDALMGTVWMFFSLPCSYQPLVPNTGRMAVGLVAEITARKI